MANIIQDPNTPKYNTTTGLLTDYGRSLGLKEVNSIISSDTLLKPKNKIKLQTGFPTTSPLISMTDTTSPELQAERDRLAKEKLSQEGNISSLMTTLGLEQGKEAGYATEAGADTAQKEYDRFASELAGEQRANELAKRDILSNASYTKEQANNAISAIERTSLQKQADIAILGNAAKGRFDTAMDIAKRKVESAIAPLKAELEAKKFIYENNKDLFNKAELSKLDTLIKADDRKIVKEEERQTKGEEMIINALQSKAPQDLVTKARETLKNGGSLEDVTLILGNYGMSLSDRLDTQLKQAQLSKLNKEISLLGEPTPKEKEAEAKALQTKEGQSLVLKEKINLIDSIYNNAGMQYRVGTNRSSRQGYFAGVAGIGGVGQSVPALISEAKGQGQQFAGGVHKLASREFLDALIGAKQQGATFGALTDREGDALRAAATQLNDWEIKDKRGMPTGRWNIDEVSFKRELDNLKRLAYKGIANSGGTLLQDDELTALDNIYNDSALMNPSSYY